MQITKIKSENLEIIVMYRSEQGNLSELLENLKMIIKPFKNTIVCGDFNLCFLSNRKNKLSKHPEENGFCQLIKEATHIRGRNIDHFYLKTRNDIQDNVSVLRYSPYYSDHDALCITIPQLENLN